MSLIYLVGMRGSGKTTVGKLVAAQNSCGFIDLDQFLCESENTTIENIVATQGWAAFRSLEKGYLGKATALLQKGGVIATGGGIVLDKENRLLMRKNGHVVWLAPSVEVLHERLVADPLAEQRPPLTNSPLFEELQRIAAERADLYRQSATLILNGREPAEQLARQILRQLV